MNGNEKPILLFLVALTVIACGREIVEYVTLHQYNYLNNSDSDIEIYSFRNGKTYNHHLRNGETYVEEIKLNSDFNYESMIYEADSVKIVYGNARYKSWKLTDIDPRNILRKYENFILISEKERYREYGFTFIRADMDNAIPCNGTCN